MVRRSRELTPARTQALASKKAKTSTMAGPHLARGRSENLIRSRTCTPSDEEMDSAGEVESTTMLTESNLADDPSSPPSGRLHSAASFTPSAFSPASAQTASIYSPTTAQLHEAEPRRRPSQEWVLASMEEEDEREPPILAGLLKREQPQITYPLRLSDTNQGPPSTAPSISSIITSPRPAFTSPTPARRTSESALRPLAKRPANYRHEPMVEDQGEQSGRTVKGKQKGIKKPYKTQEQRDKVKAVRVHGACLRCQIMRQACQVTEPGNPCANCQVSRRKFSIPCTRAGPSIRWKYLFPELVMSRHDYRNHRVIMSQDMPGMFRMVLTHVSGFNLNLNVIEDSTIPDSELRRTHFAEQGEGNDVRQYIVQDKTAPLVPVITTSFKDVAEWIASQIAQTQASLFKDLPRKVFPESKGQHWPRAVLFLFQDFHKSVYQSRRILKVFKTLIVRHLMSRRFYVPFDLMSEVNAKLSPQYRETDEELHVRERDQECMVPKFINNYLKAALMHLLKESVKADFIELEVMFKLHEKSPGSEITDLDRDEALCYVAMMLILASIMQIKIMEVAQSRDSEASYKCPLGPQTQNVENAKKTVREIEEEVIDHVLGLWTYKFVKSNRKGKLGPEQIIASHEAQMFNLVDKFKQMRHEHESILSPYTDLSLNLDDSHIPRFLVDNPTRVLLRFAETLAPSKPRR